MAIDPKACLGDPCFDRWTSPPARSSDIAKAADLEVDEWRRVCRVFVWLV